MKTRTTRTIAKVITLSLLTATALHATNGDNLIAVGAKARAMGGTGIAVSHGSESTLSNPAMITSVEGTEISFGGTLFMPDINTQFNASGAPATPITFTVPPQSEYRSAADRNIIPEVSIAHKINDNWFIGAGMFGTAGMGTDYRGTQDLNTLNLGNFNMVTNLQLLQFAVPVAYKYEGFSVAVSAILQYGNLDINYDGPSGTVGAGLAQDFGIGWNAGAAYDFSNGLIIGAMYKSKIGMTYKGQISNATGGFPILLGDNLDQPAEYGAGISYNMGEHTFAFDYKKIKWSQASGYSDFGWEDQNIYAFGYEYAQDNWALRAGYNYGSSAVVELTEVGDGQASSKNLFNLLGFPATAERHYTFGGTYKITEAFGIDLAYVYSPEVTKTFATPAFAGPITAGGLGIASITNKHQEDSLSFQLTYNF